ncbi:phosphatidylinositol N-acetylglucosaminyltransferase subunit H isoform X4 [Rhineura floridana]|uniref:phosphatidylinositol N-acetylglucosaminyltransferase subunit H isoform X4 n=1 Tax=Rhineura floridana TaxID=261503 RepID=UPI002AC8435B|nr:phosphatidylinositol N-acetylglucosaminyltransferase subunit H isoform X4 [Rhineura floridana]
MAEEERYLALSGERITLQRRHHSASCREFQNSVVLSAAIFITLIGLLMYLHFVKIDQESLLIVGSLGIQMTSSFASGKESTTFIEMSQVKDVVINEAIYMVNLICCQKVIYYLCILLQDPMEPHVVSEVVPLFQSSKPRLDCLVQVYKSCQEILEQRKKS